MIADADYFALVGTTGAGKSTVIDAMTFARMVVPRWDNQRTRGVARPRAAGRCAWCSTWAGSATWPLVKRRAAGSGSASVRNARLGSPARLPPGRGGGRRGHRAARGRGGGDHRGGAGAARAAVRRLLHLCGVAAAGRLRRVPARRTAQAPGEAGAHPRSRPVRHHRPRGQRGDGGQAARRGADRAARLLRRRHRGGRAGGRGAGPGAGRAAGSGPRHRSWRRPRPSTGRPPSCANGCATSCGSWRALAVPEVDRLHQRKRSASGAGAGRPPSGWPSRRAPMTAPARLAAAPARGPLEQLRAAITLSWRRARPNCPG